ncbi:DoxX family protein [Burkholderia sp. Bp9142]|uniref:DoxX family protein n=1 Tax=Burkholderia sp. Bp9142 TaxID=2184573 RepID=UPI000F5A7F68|nr:DoxX family protein [Burkholderia sp. Bp9142]RQR24609.1 DoxX family protein [Burkholderia sp. Bp9142]
MWNSSIATVGRVLLAGLFLASGLSKLGAVAATQAYIASAHLPLVGFVYVLTVIVEVGGGLMLLLGFQARPVAAVLAIFTVAAAFVFHHNFADQNQAIHFLKNFAIAGGLLQVVAAGASRFSLDSRRLQKV